MRRRLPTFGTFVTALILASVPLPASAQGDVHVVQAGDTLTAIAVRYGTTVDELRRRNGLDDDVVRVGERLVLPGHDGWRMEAAPTGSDWADVAAAWGLPEDLLREANPDVASPAGRLLRVPPDVGRLATPRPGEDLVAFAARVGAAPGAIARRNGLQTPYRIEPGLPLLLPVDAIDLPADPAPASELGADAASGRSGGPATAGRADSTAVASEREARTHEALRDAALDSLGTLLAGVRLEPPDDAFAWPLAVELRITSRFGWRAISVAGNRYHLGLDLGAPSGTPVVAARDGVVERQGWIGAYGYAVYLRHADGFETRYAHLSRIEVETGETVQAGQRVGRVGTTGASTGPHLHFEVRLDGRALDPLELLPQPGSDEARAN